MLKVSDKVNHPSHYTWLKKLCGIEVIDITRHMCFNLGNVVKYVLRAGHKSEEGYSDFDKEIEDLKKAKWYLEDEIKLRSGEDTSDQARIKDLQAEIDAQEEAISELNNIIRELKSSPILGEVKLSVEEVKTIAEQVLSAKTVDSPIKITQTGGSGIGRATTLEFSFVKENSEKANVKDDVTDYRSW